MTVDEFQSALKSVCLGKEYDDLPSAFKQFITAMFNTIDTDGENEQVSSDSNVSYFQVMASLVLLSTVMTVSPGKL